VDELGSQAQRAGDQLVSVGGGVNAVDAGGDPAARKAALYTRVATT
jgi:hypothetical protein